MGRCSPWSTSKGPWTSFRLPDPTGNCRVREIAKARNRPIAAIPGGAQPTRLLCRDRFDH